MSFAYVRHQASMNPIPILDRVPRQKQYKAVSGRCIDFFTNGGWLQG